MDCFVFLQHIIFHCINARGYLYIFSEESLVETAKSLGKVEKNPLERKIFLLQWVRNYHQKFYLHCLIQSAFC